MGEVQNKSLEFEAFSKNPFFKEDLGAHIKGFVSAIPHAAAVFIVAYLAISHYFTEKLVDLTYSLTSGGP